PQNHSPFPYTTLFRSELLAEQADKQQVTRNLLTDTSYEEKLQRFEEKKAGFADLAKQWSINKAIIEAVNQTMNELKEKKLPAVLDRKSTRLNSSHVKI